MNGFVSAAAAVNMTASASPRRVPLAARAQEQARGRTPVSLARVTAPKAAAQPSVSGFQSAF
ncbi:hypothetical protein [Streptomyces sp. NBC_01431]|uniref:hypothetical protein n=1 Tax=Streptomyces sp. NBC_01431 TaxID=2903863 RepID=UPI002E3783CF|nr:hypothetical protein [Streptomyces sp. NBC_01431]